MASTHPDVIHVGELTIHRSDGLVSVDGRTLTLSIREFGLLLALADAQGRILLHPLLRRSAGVVGEVAVLGYLTYLEVWELERFQQRLLADPYTEEDEASIARLGI